MIQRQFHSEKGTNRVTNKTTPNPYYYKKSRHNLLQFDNNRTSTAQTVSNTQFAALQLNETRTAAKSASAMSLPRVSQTNASQQYQNPHYPTGVHFSSGSRTEEPNDENCFPPIQHSTIKAPILFAVHHHSLFIFRLVRKI